MSKERPIIFSTEMVEAIIAGRKTQTRRPLNPQPEEYKYEKNNNYRRDAVTRGQDGSTLAMFTISKLDNVTGTWGIPRYLKQEVRYPHGQPGDLLWVRETFCKSFNGNYLYKASCPDFLVPVARWTPSIHMPRSASRITLRVDDVWVHRIQDIQSNEAKAEGVLPSPTQNYVDIFEQLWNSIYNNWDDNPWVWAITFSVVEVKR